MVFFKSGPLLAILYALWIPRIEGTSSRIVKSVYDGLTKTNFLLAAKADRSKLLATKDNLYSCLQFTSELNRPNDIRFTSFDDFNRMIFRYLNDIATNVIRKRTDIRVPDVLVQHWLEEYHSVTPEMIDGLKGLVADVYELQTQFESYANTLHWKKFHLAVTVAAQSRNPSDVVYVTSAGSAFSMSDFLRYPERAKRGFPKDIADSLSVMETAVGSHVGIPRVPKRTVVSLVGADFLEFIDSIDELSSVFKTLMVDMDATRDILTYQLVPMIETNRRLKSLEQSIEKRIAFLFDLEDQASDQARKEQLFRDISIEEGYLASIKNIKTLFDTYSDPYLESFLNLIARDLNTVYTWKVEIKHRLDVLAVNEDISDDNRSLVSSSLISMHEKLSDVENERSELSARLGYGLK